MYSYGATGEVRVEEVRVDLSSFDLIRKTLFPISSDVEGGEGPSSEDTGCYPEYPLKHDSVAGRLGPVLDIRRQLDVACFYLMYTVFKNQYGECSELFSSCRNLFSACQNILDYIRRQREIYKESKLSLWRRAINFMRIYIFRRDIRKFSDDEFLNAINSRVGDVVQQFAHVRNHLFDAKVPLSNIAFIEAIVTNFIKALKGLKEDDVLTEMGGESALFGPPAKTVEMRENESTALAKRPQYFLAVDNSAGIYSEWFKSLGFPVKSLAIASIPDDSYSHPRLRGKECFWGWVIGLSSMIVPFLFRQDDLPIEDQQHVFGHAFSISELTVLLRIPVWLALFKAWGSKFLRTSKEWAGRKPDMPRWPSPAKFILMLGASIGGLLLTNQVFPDAKAKASEALGSSYEGEFFVDSYTFFLFWLLGGITADHLIHLRRFATTGAPNGGKLVIGEISTGQLQRKGLSRLQISAISIYFQTKWRKFHRLIYPSWYEAYLRKIGYALRKLFTSLSTDYDHDLKRSGIDKTYRAIIAAIDLLQDGRPAGARDYIRRKIGFRDQKIKNIEHLLQIMEGLGDTSRDLKIVGRSAKKDSVRRYTKAEIEKRLSYLQNKNSLLRLMIAWPDSEEVAIVRQESQMSIREPSPSFNSFISQLRTLETEGETVNPWRGEKLYYREGGAPSCRV